MSARSSRPTSPERKALATFWGRLAIACIVTGLALGWESLGARSTAPALGLAVLVGATIAAPTYALISAIPSRFRALVFLLPVGLGAGEVHWAATRLALPLVSAARLISFVIGALVAVVVARGVARLLRGGETGGDGFWVIFPAVATGLLVVAPVALGALEAISRVDESIPLLIAGLGVAVVQWAHPRARAALCFVGALSFLALSARLPPDYEALSLVLHSLILVALVLGLMPVDEPAMGATRWSRRWLNLLVIALFSLAALGAAGLVIREVPIAFEAAPVTSHGTTAWVRALRRASDRDDDGVGSILGERDCEPRDPSVAPGLHEIPGNGRDDDCQRGDAAMRWDTPIGISVPPPPAVANDIVFVLIDTLRADSTRDLGVAPAWREFRAQSLDFSSTFSTSSFTVSVLVTLLSGRLPSAAALEFTAPFTALPLRSESTLFDWMRAAGYRTGAAVATEGLKSIYDPRYFGHGLELVRRSSAFVASPDETLADARQLWAELGSSGRKRFLLIHLMSVHAYAAPSRAAYDAAVHSTLMELGRFLGELPPGALVVVTSDHGEEFGEHDGKMHAQTLFDEVTHVPLLVRWPGEPGRVVHSTTSLLQVFPTLVAATNPGLISSEAGPFICVRAVGPCPDATAVMALEREGAHLHGVRTAETLVIHDLVHRRWSAHGRSSAAASRADEDDARQLLERLEDRAFGPRTPQESWPGRLPPGLSAR